VCACRAFEATHQEDAFLVRAERGVSKGLRRITAAQETLEQGLSVQRGAVKKVAYLHGHSASTD
jgi:hypothetical protein